MEGLDGEKGSRKEKLGLTRKERNAAIRAAFACYLPIFLGVIACFVLAILFMSLWLH